VCGAISLEIGAALKLLGVGFLRLLL